MSLRVLLVLFISFIGFSLALKYRVAGMYIYWWYAIFRPHDWAFGYITDLRLAVVALLLFVIPSLLQRIRPKFNHPISILILLFYILIVIADLLNGCGVFVRTGTILSLFILFYVILLSSELLDTPKRIFWLIVIVSLSMAVHSGKGGIFALVTGSIMKGITFLGGFMTGSNAYALTTGMLLFFMIFTVQHINSPLVYKKMGRWFNKKHIIYSFKLLMFALFLGSIYMIIALQSRGSFIATIGALFLWVLLQKNRNTFMIVIVIVFSLALPVIPIPEGYKERITSVFTHDESEGERGRSAAGRTHMWNVALDMAASHPFGVGPGCYSSYYSLYDTTGGLYGRNRSPHSNHFQVLADVGYLGIIIWFLLFIISYQILFKIRKMSKEIMHDDHKKKFYFDLSNALICTQSVFLFGGAFYEVAYNDIIWIVLALVISIDRMLTKEIDAVKIP